MFLTLVLFFYFSWNSGLFLSKKQPGAVDFRDVVTPHTRHGFINDKHRCFVCGLFGGLKTACDHPGCLKKRGGEDNSVDSLYFHPTCARQAGLEVSEADKFYGTS